MGLYWRRVPAALLGRNAELRRNAERCGEAETPRRTIFSG
jgi:hypothetical protein